MASIAPHERAALDELEPRWRERGYTVIREPRADQLPDFLRDFRPDAIAVGAHPSLVIEVLPKRDGTARSKTRQMQGLFAEHDDWRLEVVYAPPEGPQLREASAESIRETLRRSLLLAKDEPRAALMLAWAALEAAARHVEPGLAARGLSPRALVDLLISTGRAEQAQGAQLRALADLRHALTHGEIDAAPTTDEVRLLVEMAEGLAGAKPV